MTRKPGLRFGTRTIARWCSRQMWHMLCAHCLEQASLWALGIWRPPQGPGLQGLPGSQPVVRKRLSSDRPDAEQPVRRGLGCRVCKVLHTQTNSSRAVAVPGDTGPAGTVVLVRNLPALQASQADQGQHAHAPSGKSDAAAAASSPSLPRAGRHPNNLGILLS